MVREADLSFFFFFFWLCCVACRILAPRPGLEPTPPALEARSLNHWTAREVQVYASISNTDRQSHPHGICLCSACSGESSTSGAVPTIT